MKRGERLCLATEITLLVCKHCAIVEQTALSNECTLLELICAYLPFSFFQLITGASGQGKTSLIYRLVNYSYHGLRSNKQGSMTLKMDNGELH